MKDLPKNNNSPTSTAQAGNHHRRRRKGQALAEFALTLPILLLLIFGIIEFGRIFQAWVSLQNAARAAARYATTGEVNEDRFDLDTIVPCTVDDQRGNVNLFTHPIYTDYQVQYYANGDESLFATWYNGIDCDPGNSNHQIWRRDILRLASIYEEARIGAAGLSLEPPRLTNTPDSVRDWLYSNWNIPLPGSSNSRWFNLMVCSSRPATDELSGFLDATTKSRFVTVLDAANDPNPTVRSWVYEAPYCMLNEIPTATALGAGGLNNAGIRWMDAGGPGDRVTIVVRFNHPLITPLPLQDFITLQARRAAVNESFTAARAVGSIQGSSIGSPTLPTPTPVTPTETNTPTATLTATTIPVTETFTPTYTPEPFSCDDLDVANVTFNQNRVYITFTNDNFQSTELLHVNLFWPNDPSHPLRVDYPNVYVNSMAMNNEVFWISSGPGQDDTAPTNTSNEGSFFSSADREVPGFATSAFEAVFVGPPLAGQYLTPWDFDLSTFTFLNPETGGDCVKALRLPPTPLPTDTPDPSISPTPTYTPDCASSTLRVDFVSFDSFGDVRLRVTNNRSVVAPFTGFHLVWPAKPGLVFEKFVVGGRNADDIPEINPAGTGVKVWQGPDMSPNTTSLPSNRSDGTWVVDYSFPPNSQTELHLDFSGSGAATLSGAFGISASDFNGSYFEIGCGSTGVGGSGSGSSGTIFLTENPTPRPTNTPRPTRTPGPTNTPRPTNTPFTPTATFTPLPTYTPLPATNTPEPSITPTPTIPGVGGVGGSDGGG